MTVKSVEASKRQWWSIPQTIVWMVGRDQALTMRAVTVADIEALETWEEMPTPASPLTGEPPILRTIAPGELIRAAVEGRIEIRGSYQGTGETQPVPVQKMQRPSLRDDIDGPAIADDGLWGLAHKTWVWRGLWIDADQCMAQWPGSVETARRRRGRRPDQLNAIREYLREKYGVRGPGNTIKQESLLTELRSAKIPASLRTIGRALSELEAN